MVSKNLKGQFMRTPLSNYQIDEIKRLYCNGKSIYKLMDKYHTSSYRIKGILRLGKIKVVRRIPNKKFNSKEEENKLINDFKSGKTIQQLKKYYGCSEHVILRILKKYEIPYNSRKLGIPKEEEIKEILRLYNKELKSILEISKIIKREQLFVSKILKNNNYGPGVGINKDYGTGHFMKGKKLIQFYGVEKAKILLQKNIEQRKKLIFPIKDTKIEVKIQNFLTYLQIEYFTHKYMNIEHGYQCDIFIPIQEGILRNIIIECDGDAFHYNPIKYKAEDRIFKNGMTAQERWDLDKSRTEELEAKGYRVIRLWETDIKKMDLNKFKEVI
jgi:G:T-mismatch repair DNA endonuclease (very short patch repair protein)